MASASPPPAPAQYKFSIDGRYLKFVTRCFDMALIPVCRGVGGGPAGCCATYVSTALAVNNGRAGRETTGKSAPSSGRSFVCALTISLHEITSAIPKTNTSKCFRITPPAKLGKAHVRRMHGNERRGFKRAGLEED